MNYLFIADSFYEDGHPGGAEACNKELINKLIQRGHNVFKVYSFFVSKAFLESIKDIDVIIIGNFLGLTAESKEYLAKTKYCLYEHDHKYLANRDPSVFPDYLAPKDVIINLDFYKNAYKVVAQSSRHVNIIKKNTGLQNVVYGVNLWSEEEMQDLKDFCNNEKKHSAAIMDHIFVQKNKKGAVDYCEKNNIDYILIPNATPHREFCELLSQCRSFVFFPQVNETLSRVSIEAHCLNTELIVNNNISYLDEHWSSLRGKKLIEFLENQFEETVNIFES